MADMVQFPAVINEDDDQQLRVSAELLFRKKNHRSKGITRYEKNRSELLSLSADNERGT
jgi:hypothetical protein